MSKEELSEAREQINKIDDEMSRLFELRMEAVKQIAQYKKEHGLPIKDKRREDEMIERLSAQISDETIRQYYVRFLRSTIDISCDYQHVLSEGSKVAYCGEKGAFAYFAMKHIFPDSLDCRFDTFADAYESVVKGECDYAVLPMENSASGEVGQVTDMLFSGSLYVTAMYDMPINQSLIGVKGASLGDIKKIYSHPQAISQCAKYLQRHKIEAVETSSTSAAIKYVSELNDKTVAAIGCEQAADFYGMNILDPIINEQRANTTRFGVFSRALSNTAGKNPGDNFILTFTVRNEAGALAEAVSIISSYDFNMRTLRSRPMKDLLWNYYFFVEAEGDIMGESGKAMMRALSGCCDKLKVAGIYQYK